MECVNCAYYCEVFKTTQYDSGPVVVGQCRKNAPGGEGFSPNQAKKNNDDNRSKWPLVVPTDFCGQYNQKIRTPFGLSQQSAT